MTVLRRIKVFLLTLSVAVMALAVWTGPTRVSASGPCPELLGGATASSTQLFITRACGGGGGSNNPPPCYGDSCTGLDPDKTGCSNGASTLQSAGGGPNAPYVELRFSSWCFAAWADVTDCKDCGQKTTYAEGTTCYGCAATVTETGPDAYGSAPVGSSGPQTMHSPMISYYDYVRACSQDSQYPQGYPTICTAWEG